MASRSDSTREEAEEEAEEEEDRRQATLVIGLVLRWDGKNGLPYS